MDLEPFAAAQRVVVVDDPQPPKHAMQEAHPSSMTVESTPKDTPEHATQEAHPSSKPIGVTSASEPKPAGSASASPRESPAMRLRNYLAQVGIFVHASSVSNSLMVAMHLPVPGQSQQESPGRIETQHGTEEKEERSAKDRQGRKR